MLLTIYVIGIAVTFFIVAPLMAWETKSGETGIMMSIMSLVWPFIFFVFFYEALEDLSKKRM